MSTGGKMLRDRCDAAGGSMWRFFLERSSLKKLPGARKNPCKGICLLKKQKVPYLFLTFCRPETTSGCFFSICKKIAMRYQTQLSLVSRQWVFWYRQDFFLPKRYLFFVLFSRCKIVHLFYSASS